VLEVERSKRVGFMYGAIAIVMVVLDLYFSVAFLGEGQVLYAGGMFIVTVVCVLVFVDYLRTPEKPIIITEEGNILLPRYDVVLSCEDVVNISYIRATGRGISYKWGKILVHTKTDVYKTNYVDDCEENADRLLAKVYELKRVDY